MKMALKEHQVLLMNFDACSNTDTCSVRKEVGELNYCKVLDFIIIADIPLSSLKNNIKFEKKIEN